MINWEQIIKELNEFHERCELMIKTSVKVENKKVKK